jgi:hypothetical protein
MVPIEALIMVALKRPGGVPGEEVRLDPAQGDLPAHLLGRHHQGEVRLGLLGIRAAVAVPAVAGRDALQRGHAVERLHQVRHPVGAAHLAVGEDLHARLSLDLEVGEGRPVLHLAELLEADPSLVVVGSRLQQLGRPQQAADVLGPVLGPHGSLLLLRNVRRLRREQQIGLRP